MDGEKRTRVNFYISEVQKQRMQELCDLHGHTSVNQCAKYLLQRGLTIECSSSGIIHTNEKLDEMVDLFKQDSLLGGSCSTATESQVRENTIPMELE